MGDLCATDVLPLSCISPASVDHHTVLFGHLKFSYIFTYCLDQFTHLGKGRAIPPHMLVLLSTLESDKYEKVGALLGQS